MNEKKVDDFEQARLLIPAINERINHFGIKKAVYDLLPNITESEFNIITGLMLTAYSNAVAISKMVA